MGPTPRWWKPPIMWSACLQVGSCGFPIQGDTEEMQIAAAVAVVIVAALHAYFLALEMFLWRTPFGRRTFNMTQEVADSSAVLAGHHGLDNGVLAAGPLWAGVRYCGC